MRSRGRFSLNRSLLVSVILALGFFAAPAWGQDESASTSNGGDWTDTTTWACISGMSPCIPNNANGYTYDTIMNGGTVNLDNLSSLTNISVNSINITAAGTLQVLYGEVLNTSTSGGASGNVTNAGTLNVGYGNNANSSSMTSFANGATLNVAGNLTNSGAMTIGSSGGMESLGNANGIVNIAGTFDDTNGSLSIYGGGTAASTMKVGGPAPSTLMGSISIFSTGAGAYLNYGSGAITQIGSSGSIDLEGSASFIGVGSTPPASNSALDQLTTIASGGTLAIEAGETVGTSPIGGTFTNSGTLNVGDLSADVGTPAFNVTGNLANSGAMTVGSFNLGGGLVSVSGNFDNTGGTLTLNGGNYSTAMTVGGQAPSALLGTFTISGMTLNIDGNQINSGTSYLDYGSGAITQLGNGTSTPGSLTLDGNSAFISIGGSTPTSSNALNTLTTIAAGGNLTLQDGAQVTTTPTGGTFTIGGGVGLTMGGMINVGSAGNFQSAEDSQGNTVYANGSTLNINGSLTNNGCIYLGGTGGNTNGVLNVSGTFDNTGGGLTINGGATAPTTMTAGGAAPSTLLGQFTIIGWTEAAYLNYGSGAITQIGTPTKLGPTCQLDIYGTNAFIGSGAGAPTSNSALDTLAANYGYFELYDGAQVNTNPAGGTFHNYGLIYVGFGTAGYDTAVNGSALNITGNLANGTANGQTGGMELGAQDEENGTVTVSGTFDNTGGSLAINGGPSAPSTMTVGGAAPSILAGYFGISAYYTGAYLNYGSGAVTQIGDGATNSATLILDGANAFLGAGGSAPTSNSALNTLATVASNGTFALSDGATVNTTPVGGTFNNAGLLYVGYNPGNYGPGVNPADGTLLNITGDMNNTNLVQIGNNTNNGTLAVSGNMANTGSVTIDALANLQATGTTGYTQTGSSASTTLNGSLTASTVNFTGGTLSGSGGTITGNVTNSGATVVPGSATAPGVINVAGNFTQGSSGTFLENISGTGSGQFSVLNVTTGGVSLGGTLKVTALSGFSPANGQTFTFIDSSGAVSGAFNTLKYGSYSESGSNILSIGSNLDLEVLYNANNVELEVLTQSGGGSGGGGSGGGGSTGSSDNWQGGTGSWNTSSNSSNWTTGLIPTSAQSVTLGTGTGGTVTYNDTSDTISSLSVQSGTQGSYTLNIPAGALTVTNGITVASKNTIDVSGSTASLAGGSLSNSGTLSVTNGGLLTIGGSFANGGSVTVGGAGGIGTVSAGTFDDTGGSLQINGGSSAQSTMTVAGAAPSTLQGSVAITGNGGGAYLNYQTGGTGITAIGDGASNGGSLTLDGSNAFIGSGSTSAPTSNSALTNLATIAGNGTLFLRDGATITTTPSGGTLTNAGTLGVGDLGSANGSTLTITGNLANSGVMTVGTTSSSGVVNVSGSTTEPTELSGSATRNISAASPVTETVNNTGTLSIGSTGALNLLGDGTFTQTGGTTTLNGSLTASTINFSGGSLTGSGGTITGNFTNSGATVAPGSASAPGVLNIAGNFTQGSGGTFLENISGTNAGQFGVLNVTAGSLTGKVSLGGTLNVASLSGFSFANGQTFTFIDSSSSVSGAFNTIKYGAYSESGSNVLPIGINLELEVLYSANYVELEVLAQSAGLVLTPNQTAVYNMLNNLAASPPGADFTSVMGVIDSLPTSSAAANALQQVSADKVQALSDMSFTEISLQTDSLSRRITNLRYGTDNSTGAGCNSFSLPGTGWSLFVDPSGFTASRSTTINRTGYDLSGEGFTVGADRIVSDNLLLGAATGFNHANASFSGSGGSADLDMVPITLYASYMPPQCYYLFGSAGYAYNGYELKRDIDFSSTGGTVNRVATSYPDGNLFYVHAEGGTDLKVNLPAVITPLVKVDYSHLDVNSFTETGANALDLSVSSQTVESLQTGIGARVSAPFTYHDTKVAPQVYATWQHEFCNGSRTIESNIQGGSVFGWQTEGARRDFANVGADVSVFTNKNMSVYINYSSDVGAGSPTQRFSGGLRWQF